MPTTASVTSSAAAAGFDAGIGTTASVTLSTVAAMTGAAAGVGAGPANVAGADEAAEAAGSTPVLSRTQAITWPRVGKSRRATLSSRSTLNRSRTAANTSACLTVSTP